MLPTQLDCVTQGSSAFLSTQPPLECSERVVRATQKWPAQEVGPSPKWLPQEAGPNRPPPPHTACKEGKLKGGRRHSLTLTEGHPGASQPSRSPSGKPFQKAANKQAQLYKGLTHFLKSSENAKGRRGRGAHWAPHQDSLLRGHVRTKRDGDDDPSTVQLLL